MSDPREELLTLLRSRSLAFGDFVLSSGAKSHYYIDARLTTLDPLGASLIGAAFLDRMAALGIRADAVGGLTMGADPIALAIAMTGHQRGLSLQAIVVRKEAKGHGRGKRIEGNLRPGDRVLVVEDVISTGASALSAIEAIQEAGAEVVYVMGLVDRQMGGRERIAAAGHPVDALFTVEEILQGSGGSPDHIK